MPFKKFFLFTLLLSCSFILSSYAQSEDPKVAKAVDELVGKPVDVLQDTTRVADSLSLFENRKDISAEDFDSLFVASDTTVKKPRIQVGSVLSRLISSTKDYSIELGKLRIILAEIPDTALLNRRIPELKLATTQLHEFTLERTGEVNLRYLKGVENFLFYIEDEKSTYDEMISDRLSELLEVGEKIDEIRADTLINMSMRDTTSLPEISKELRRLKSTIQEIDSALVQQELGLTRFQAINSDLTIDILELNQSFKERETEIKQKAWRKETSYLWEKSYLENQYSFSSILENSWKTNYFVLKRYISQFSPLIIGYSLLMIILFFLTRSIIGKINSGNEYADLILDRTQYLKNNLIASFVVMGIPFFYLMLDHPPMALTSILSMIMVIFSGFLVKTHFGNSLFVKWIFFLPLFLFSGLIALNWRFTMLERPIIYLIPILSILMAALIYRDIKDRKFKGDRILKYLLIFTTCFALCSLGLNIMGRFSLAKVFAISGLTGFYRGVSLYLFVQVVLKTVYLWTEASKKRSDSYTSFFDFQEIQKRLQGVLNVLAISFWAYAVLFHLGMFDPIYDETLTFISEERTLGNATFTFGTILLFFFILIISQFLANNIAYFASIKDQQYASSRKKRLGSSILLIRLGVITIGFLLAMTAAKIPLDKITIVLGALSVGIGFGLQTLINNLVSGIILAFERPIQIGDDIKIGELTGKVKEVGVRASKILAYDGSDIVVPNGDLLSGQLINWTLSDKRRRVELFIGVAYSSDMKQVKELIEKQLQRDSIMKNPNPMVLMQNFGDNSVDFRVLFWVESIDFWIETRAEVMTGIFESFNENGVEIPFPQRDLYLKTFPQGTKQSEYLNKFIEEKYTPIEGSGHKGEVDANKKPSED